MVDEMLVAQAEWLPQYSGAIDDARQRLSLKTVKTRDWQGAARREMRSIEVVRAEHAKQKEGQSPRKAVS
jgi:alpha-galactosidase